MLRISEKTNLAIFFLLTLAEGQSASVADVAKRWTFVSPGYLEEVVAALRKAGLVFGKKGRGGGYVLAKPSSDMTILDIVKAIDGPFALVETPVHKKMRDSTFEGWCVSRRLWGRVQQGVEGTLKGITLADLVKEGVEFARPLSIVIASEAKQSHRRSGQAPQSIRSPRPSASR